MIFDSLRRESPAAEDSLRRRGGVKVHNDESKKLKNCRRRRMELRRFKRISGEKSAGNSPISSDYGGVCLKKNRLEIEKAEPKRRNDVVGESRDLTSHGTVSVIGRRREMEDAAAVELDFLERGGRSYDFFGVYDGHGGRRVAEACGEMMHKLLRRIVVEEESGEVVDWRRVMVAGFKEMDEEVNKSGEAVATTGSTAVVAVVGETEIVVANCGDSRAVLSRGGVAVQVSDDHKPDRPDELERIENCGGKVINWNGQRVLGVLATSRSIGDQYLKPFVITEPEVKVINRTHRDEFLVLASDGLWDVVSNDLACQVVRRCLDGRLRCSRLVTVQDMINSPTHFEGIVTGSPAVEAAAVLAELAMARGSRDNISVTMVELKPSG
ncbi:hypothetical protein BUALT_Bualt06G0093400 [Buddleja alternifolia]|uniref:protein-serine/threonine phosphatase n=1 Tax=Buddleja alternifolia TaxID=168488 RepID=A0AAV6XF94_9LAMI|nr:hypothetical protein BUALT_Bualt06G0093400 [Buddleja alternifolia]